MFAQLERIRAVSFAAKAPENRFLPSLRSKHAARPGAAAAPKLLHETWAMGIRGSPGTFLGSRRMRTGRRGESALCASLAWAAYYFICGATGQPSNSGRVRSRKHCAVRAIDTHASHTGTKRATFRRPLTRFLLSYIAFRYLSLLDNAPGCSLG